MPEGKKVGHSKQGFLANQTSPPSGLRPSVVKVQDYTSQKMDKVDFYSGESTVGLITWYMLNEIQEDGNEELKAAVLWAMSRAAVLWPVKETIKGLP